MYSTCISSINFVNSRIAYVYLSQVPISCTFLLCFKYIYGVKFAKTRIYGKWINKSIGRPIEILKDGWSYGEVNEPIVR